MKSSSITRRACLRGVATTVAGLSASRVFSAPAPEEILIGQSIHLSGPLAPSLTKVLKGQDLAIEEFNRRGGASGGRQVRLIKLDDAFDPKRCVENFNRLVERDKIVALYGLGSTANTAAVLPLLAERKVPLVGVYTGAPSLRTQHHPYFFTTMASYRDEVLKMIDNMMADRRRNIALIVMNNTFGKEMSEMVSEVAKERGATIVAIQTVETRGENAESACASLAGFKPDGLITMVFGSAMIPVVKAARASMSTPIYAPTIANTHATLEALGDDARGIAFTSVVPNSMRPTSDATRDYAAVMQRAGIAVDREHFFGYLNMRVLLEGMRRAGKQVTRHSLVAGLEKMRDTEVGGYKINFGPQNHHGSKYVDLSVVGQNGRFIW